MYGVYLNCFDNYILVEFFGVVIFGGYSGDLF